MDYLIVVCVSAQSILCSTLVCCTMYSDCPLERIGQSISGTAATTITHMNDLISAARCVPIEYD